MKIITFEHPTFLAGSPPGRAQRGENRRFRVVIGPQERLIMEEQRPDALGVLSWHASPSWPGVDKVVRRALYAPHALGLNQDNIPTIDVGLVDDLGPIP